jgi:excinuclease ABC subunit A
MGPEGGSRGGTVIDEGTPEKIAANPRSYTGEFLRPILEGREVPVGEAQPSLLDAGRERPVTKAAAKRAAAEARQSATAAKKAAATAKKAAATAKKTAATRTPVKKAVAKKTVAKTARVKTATRRAPVKKTAARADNEGTSRPSARLAG